MSSTMNRIASDLQKIIFESDKKKTSGYDTQATVTRLDGEVAWVQIPGGEDETPVRRTTNAGVGDNVQVRVHGGRAWLLGNTTNPPTDDTKANIALTDAAAASSNAMAASKAAEVALDSANSARNSAIQAQADANTARTAADSAQRDAESAYSSASNALDQLSVVESVVGVLDLLSKHGTYTEITDASAVAEEGKWYFTRNGSGTTEDPYVYSAVGVHVGDSVTGYYELTDIDQAVTNYVSSHLALTDDGLYLQQDGSPYRIHISTDGLEIVGQNGVIASYGASTMIGNNNGFNVKITNDELGFYDKTQRVAYLNSNQLYITKSVVLQQMDLGMPFGYMNPVTGEVGKGQWTWKIRPNKENPSRNNMYLKWMG